MRKLRCRQYALDGNTATRNHVAGQKFENKQTARESCDAGQYALDGNTATRANHVV